MKFILNFFILIVFIKYVLTQGPYDTLEECQIKCQDNDFCTTKNCIWYYGWYCSTYVKTCSDNTVCTLNDRCDKNTGECISSPVNCDDNDPCTLDECHFYAGCIHTTIPCDIVIPCNNVTDCYRGRKCETYQCNSNHVCEYQAIPCTKEQPCIELYGQCLGNPTN